MSALDSIEIHGFKSIREMKLDLGKLNVFIGANGAGKSNFISIFGLLNQIMDKQLQVAVQRWGGADSILHYGQKQTPQLVLRLTFGPNGYAAILAPSQDAGLFFVRESCWYHGPFHPRPFEVHLGSGARETGLPDEAARPRGEIARHVLESIRSWRVYHFHDTSSSAKVKLLGDVADTRAFRPDASNLAAFLLFLREKHGDQYKQIVGAVRMVAPFFRDFQLRPHPLYDQKIQLEWAEVGSDGYFNAHSLSDGTLRFICLATLLLQPSPPSTVVIDEPELGLHPFAIQVLASLVQSASLRTQVILSTQSVTLVNHFTPGDVIVVDREDGQSAFARLSEQSMSTWLEDYGLGDLWEKNVFGGRPK